MWQEETKKTETSLKQQSAFDYLVDQNLPPIRGSYCSVPLSQVTIASNYAHNHVHLFILNTKIKPHVITDFSSKRKEEFFKTHSPT